MNNLILSSLKNMADELDELQLTSFANRIDDIILQIAQNRDIDKEIEDAEKSQQDLIQQIDEGEKRLKQDQMTQIWRKTQGLSSIQNQIIQLRKELQKQKAGVEPEKETTTPMQQTAPQNTYGTYQPPSNFVNIV